MKTLLVYPAGSTKACRFAGESLEQSGIKTVDHPTPEVTHLLLDVPSFGPDGALRGGGSLSELLRMLPESITVVGGNLKNAGLEGYKTIDLLQIEEYLAQNAAITAECAIQAAAEQLEVTFARCPVLIIGWGRIGKCLARLLRALGAEVTVAARKASDRGILAALDYTSVNPAQIDLSSFRLVYNTAPETVLEQRHTAFRKNCLLVDLASKPGIQGDNVIWAKGLPGIYAPESSGTLIAEMFLKIHREEVI